MNAVVFPAVTASAKNNVCKLEPEIDFRDVKAIVLLLTIEIDRQNTTLAYTRIS